MTAAINTIGQGNVVFVGEEGLDISAALGPDTQIGWWASAADITTTSPTKTIDLKGRITSFMVSPLNLTVISVTGTGSTVQENRMALRSMSQTRNLKLKLKTQQSRSIQPLHGYLLVMISGSR